MAAGVGGAAAMGLAIAVGEGRGGLTLDMGGERG